MKYILAFLIAGMILFYCMLINAFALPILDQSLEPFDSVTFKSGIGGPFDKAQTFTSGITGKLVQVDILVNRLDRLYLKPVFNKSQIF